jgi:anti-anti-sigma regulatory factor
MEISSSRRIGNVSMITLTGRMHDDGTDDVDAHINRAAASRGVTGIHLNAARVTSISDAGYCTLIQARRTAKRHGLDFLLGVSHNGSVARFIATRPDWFSEWQMP